MSVQSAVQPTGAEHHFGVDELFFSTTDRKGVIEQANSTFVRLSHYTHEELVGSPHNIVRHPDMPGGAFKLVWDELLAGRPACAYVNNLAKDGGSYWVFATLLPLGEGFLSVRMRPLAKDFWDASRNLYHFANPAERRAREEGASRHDAAVKGAETLAHGLSSLGIPSFEAFTRTTLPAEMAQHALYSEGLPQRPEATGPLADILECMHALDDETALLVDQLDEYAAVAGELRATAATATPTIERLASVMRSAREGAASVSEQAPELVTLAEEMGERAGSASGELTELSPRLSSLEDQVGRMRLRIALLRLHNIMVGTFAAELIDGNRPTEDIRDTRESMRLLCEALGEGAQAVATDVREVREQMGVVPDQIRAAVREVDRFRRPLYKWQDMCAESGVTDQMAEATASMEAQTQQGFSELEQLSSLAARLRLLDIPFDEQAIRGDIDAIRADLAQG
ncbi:PAS domain-containing protein [Arsenicicoccus dermatophilus]|uniref:PAS domain-containing protein n=1 Tax=Arsenicicoccus dermatophilus TaxID=1076331 RepID=UPI001F4D14CE|nr:PAS domain-containing protein [Arsenicicoccus dermatophilus]MCH8611875.1 PAS domain-containing protein [Arsenicicoccus dermatophilus]